MPNELAKKGAQPSKPPKYGVLWTNSFYNGIVTQRNPLRGNAAHIEEEYYGSRYDTLIDGKNSEISTKLTLVRRPGSSAYNIHSFPTVNRFYSNRVAIYDQTRTTTSESIQVIADTPLSVYDVTGPDTNSNIFTKSTGAGSTYFQSVGNSMYFSDGVDNKKLLTPNLVWGPNQDFNPGDYILDSNGNLQEVSLDTTITANIEQIGVSHSFFPTRYIYTLALSTNSPVSGPVSIELAGLTTIAALNGTTQTLTSATGNDISFHGPLHGDLAFTAETGTVTFGDPSAPSTTGATEPFWNPTPGGTTTDGGIVWQNMGVPVKNWQLPPPAFAPSVSSSSSVYWSPNTLFPNYYVTVLDTNGNYQSVFTYGTSGSSSPAWADVGQYTQDGGILWYNIGPAHAWQPNTDVVTTPSTIHTQLSAFAVILDPNGNIQVSFDSTAPYLTGAVEPAVWGTNRGDTTADNDVTWSCFGPGRILSTGAWTWAYSYHSIDGSISTASPTTSIYSGILGTSEFLTIAGAGTDDPQCDQIWIWRTVHDGSVLFFDGAVPNPGAGTTVPIAWTFIDTNPDVALNGGPALDEFIEAPIAKSSDPPPTGLTALTYHLGRIWGGVGNFVYYSDGPDVTSGNGNTAWSPLNFFQFPSTVTRLHPTSNGLFVFTISDIYIIQGLGTPNNNFFSTPLLDGIGLSSYDAFAVNGALIFLYTSDNQVLTLDPSSGGSEVGANIGDQFGPGNGTGTFTPTSTRLTWNFSGSQEKALYVSDFHGSWWRFTGALSPETNTAWCPRADILGGFSAVQSVETSPGVHNLLIGPRTNGTILMRDRSVFTDNGLSYSSYGVIGSIVLAHPGQLACVESFTTDSMAVGTPLTLAVQLDEIAPLSSGYFEVLDAFVPDPTELDPSNSVYAQRFYLSQTQDPAVCRHLQLKVDFGKDTVKNELLSLSIFGSYDQEK